MKIEIDTRHDSKEEIINAIRILQASLGVKGSGIMRSLSISEANEDKPDFVNIFQDQAIKDKKKLWKQQAKSEAKNDGYVNLFAPNEKEEEKQEEAETKQDETESAGSLAGFFSNDESTVEEEKQKTENTGEFYKEFEDYEDKKRKFRLKLY